MGFFTSSSGNKPTEVIIRSKVGSAQINRHDIVQLAERGKIWPIESKFYAKMRLGQDKNITFSALNGDNDLLIDSQAIFFNKNTLETIILHPEGYNAAGSVPTGMTVERYTNNLQLQNSVQLVAAGTNSGKPFVRELSNGNLLMLWQDNGIRYFGVYSKELVTVVSPISLGASTSIKVKALSGGGFALLTVVGTTLNLAVFGNDGSIVQASTAIDTSVQDAEIDQLSNGQIVVLICSTSHFYAYATFAATGTPAIAKTNIVNMSGGIANARISLSVVNGFFCCLAETKSNLAICVFTNVGQVRNYNPGYNFFGQTADTTVRNAVLINDGTRFWIVAGIDLVIGPTENNSLRVLCIPTTGNNSDNRSFEFPYSVFAIPSYDGGPTFGITDAKAFYKNGNILFFYENSAVVIKTSADVVTEVINWYGGGNFVSDVVAGFDCTYLSFGLNSTEASMTLDVTKYQETAIVGVARESVAGGSENALLAFNATLGSHRSNEKPGPIETFDFTRPSGDAVYTGARGIIYSDTVVFLPALNQTP